MNLCAKFVRHIYRGILLEVTRGLVKLIVDGLEKLYYIVFLGGECVE